MFYYYSYRIDKQVLIGEPSTNVVQLVNCPRTMEYHGDKIQGYKMEMVLIFLN
jgi:hypothetical protein